MSVSGRDTPNRVPDEFYAELIWSMPASDPNQWVGSYEWSYEAQYLSRAVDYPESYSIYLGWHEDWYERHYGEEIYWTMPSIDSFGDDAGWLCITDFTPDHIGAQVVWLRNMDDGSDDPGYLMDFDINIDDITAKNPDPCVAMRTAVDESEIWGGDWGRSWVPGSE